MASDAFPASGGGAPVQEPGLGGELFLGAMGVAVVSTISESIDHRRRE